MKKETLLEIITGTIGGLIFAIGMCMWNIGTEILSQFTIFVKELSFMKIYWKIAYNT